MATIREIVTKWRYDVDTSGLKNAEAGLLKVGKGIKGATAGADAFDGTVGGLVSGLLSARAGMLGIWGAIAGTVYQMGNLGSSMIQSAGGMEQHQIAFETMLKSAERAKKLIGEIQEFAKTTPFEQDELIQYSKQLLAFGTAADQIIPTMTKLGDIAAGVGKDRLPSIVRAYGRMQVKGRVTMEELNLLLEAGVPILNVLAKQMGVTEEALYKMIERGKVRFEDTKKALDSLATGTGMFAGLMVKQSKSFGGIMSNISDYFHILGAQVGAAVLPVVKELAIAFLEFFTANEEFIKGELVQYMKDFFAVAKRAFEVTKSVSQAFVDGAKSIGGFANAVKNISKYTPLGLLYGMAEALFRIYSVAGPAFLRVAGGVRDFFASFDDKSAGARILKTIGAIIRLPYLLLDDVATYMEGGESVLGVVVDWFKKLGDSVSKFMEENGITQFFKDMWEFMQLPLHEAIVRGLTFAKEQFTIFFEWLAAKWEEVQPGILKAISAAYDYSPEDPNNQTPGVRGFVKRNIAPITKKFLQVTGQIGPDGEIPRPTQPGQIMPSTPLPFSSPGLPFMPGAAGALAAPQSFNFNNQWTVNADGLNPAAAQSVFEAANANAQRDMLKQLGDITQRKKLQ